MQGKRSDFYWECIELEHTVFFVIYVVESICKNQLGITFFFFEGQSASSERTGEA